MQNSTPRGWDFFLIASANVVRILGNESNGYLIHAIAQRQRKTVAFFLWEAAARLTGRGSRKRGYTCQVRHLFLLRRAGTNWAIILAADDNMVAHASRTLAQSSAPFQ
jgi:hypothetical protein